MRPTRQVTHWKVLFVRIKEILPWELEPTDFHVAVGRKLGTNALSICWNKKLHQIFSHFPRWFKDRGQRLKKCCGSTGQNNYSVWINEQARLRNEVRIKIFQFVVQQDRAVQSGNNRTPVFKTIRAQPSHSIIPLDAGKDNLHLQQHMPKLSHALLWLIISNHLTFFSAPSNPIRSTEPISEQGVDGISQQIKKDFGDQIEVTLAGMF